MVKRSRRAVLGSVGTTASVVLAGCGFLHIPEEEADSPSQSGEGCPSKEVLASNLPRFEGTPAALNSDRAEAIMRSIRAQAADCEWFVGSGITKDANDNFAVSISATNVSAAAQVLPEEWEGVRIMIRHDEGNWTTL